MFERGDQTRVRHLHEEDVEWNSQPSLRRDALQVGCLREPLRHCRQQLGAFFQHLQRPDGFKVSRYGRALRQLGTEHAIVSFRTVGFQVLAGNAMPKTVVASHGIT